MGRLTIHTTASLVAEVRVLTVDDLEALAVMGPGVDGHAGTLRVRHHRIAQLLAAGLKQAEVCEILGVSATSISTLMASPSMQALVNEYLQAGWAEVEAVTRRARVAASSGIEELHRRIEQGKDKVTTRDLTNATMGLLDRGGITQKHAHVHIGLSSQDVSEILKSALENDDSRVVDVTSEGEEGPVRRIPAGRAVARVSRDDESSEGWVEVRTESP